jgi:hypothetical protein
MGGGDQEVEETPYEKALSRVAWYKWKDYQQRYVPFENKAIADVTGDTKVLEDKTTAKINADLAQQVPVGGLQPGEDPSSGASMVGTQAIKVGSRGGVASAMGKQSAKDMRVQGLKAAVDIGRGQASTAQLGLSNLAKDSVKGAITDAYSDWESDSAMGAAIGSGIGTAAGAIKNYGPWGKEDKKNA